MPLVLSPGTRFGPYEIIAALGAGGMGEVYRARDPRLGREVAIKILPAAWARDAERLRRFETEARAAGQLNHPNILSVYDFSVHEGTPYLVTELLEGETLRERLTPPSALPARKAIEIAAQVARGLAAAHARGIVHRDLKPENIFLTRGGQAKILDFGLAKVTAPVSDDAVTVAAGEVTSAGSVLGTAGYMAPEQVRGEAADARSDLFALGAILYEMVAGRRAFQKATAVETMSAVLKEEPAAAAVIDPALQRVLDHCLEKDPTARFQSARDLEFALAALGGSTSMQAAALPAPRRRHGWWAPAVGVAGLVIGGLLVYFFARPPAPTIPALVRFSIPAPTGGDLPGGGLALSPDGTKMAYVAGDRTGVDQLWLRHMGALDARPLPGTIGSEWPFWSRDGARLGFFTSTGLAVMDVASGAVQSLESSPVQVARGATWGAGDMIVYQPAPTGSLLKMSVQGGTSATASTGTAVGGTDRWPQFLPDGKHFIFLRFNAHEDDGTLLEASLADSTPHVVAGVPKLESQVIYADGSLLYSLDGSLTAQPFDWRSGKTTGTPRSLAVPLMPMGLAGATGALALTAGNGLLAWDQSGQPLTQLVVVDRSGKVMRTIGAPARYLGWSLSPDGKTISASRVDSDAKADAIWLMSAATGAPRRLTFAPGQYQNQAWSPDGQWLYYGLAPGGVIDVYRKRTDGVGAAEQLTQSLYAAPHSLSPNGKLLLFSTLNGSHYDLHLRTLSPTGRPSVPDQMLQPGAGYGQFSPDGHWIAYSTEIARPEAADVFVMPNPPNSSRWQISPTNGNSPIWSHDGKDLYYQSGQQLMQVHVLPAHSGAFAFSAPQVLFAMPARQVSAYYGGYQALYSPFPDGKAFLLGEPANSAGAVTGITVVTNWPRALAH
ncbi:MAG: serine/threonine-protein kinase [Acidobacteria bacterium]|nr:MAG: serine/threonine-protein kinase [Acidobacteriota bacterium]